MKDALIDGLGARGREFWDEQQKQLEFDPHEAQVLLEACRILDTIESLSEAIGADGVMVVGSQGQPVLNGAVAELRQQQAALARLIIQLNLDAPDVAGAVTARAAAGRAAAQKRWRDQKDRSA
jgi:hypothetical protein